MIIESKVLVPAVAGFVTASLALAAAFGLDLTAQQQQTILGVATAAVVLLQAVLGYLAPHTARPDLEPAEAHVAPNAAHVPPQADGGYSLVEVALAVLLFVLAVVILIRFV